MSMSFDQLIIHIYRTSDHSIKYISDFHTITTEIHQESFVVEWQQLKNDKEVWEYIKGKPGIESIREVKVEKGI